MSLVVRQAVLADIAALGRLNAEIQALHVSARPDVFVAVSASALADWLRTVLGRPECRAWLAELDGIPVGYLLAMIHDRPATPFSTPRRWCEIDQLGVAEEMRGRGVARALVEASVSWARERGAGSITAQCWA
ncbi:MAG TPA: GNAT family N-acetyltransferase, partial [Methylomirabilota bacterium]|nr:GNAT family N-acetyltransferase [Methylomirabilota bacterium]